MPKGVIGARARQAPHRKLYNHFCSGAVRGNSARHQKRLLLIVDEQRARLQILIPLLAGLQAFGIVGIAVQNAHLHNAKAITSQGLTLLLAWHSGGCTAAQMKTSQSAACCQNAHACPAGLKLLSVGQFHPSRTHACNQAPLEALHEGCWGCLLHRCLISRCCRSKQCSTSVTDAQHLQCQQVDRHI